MKYKENIRLEMLIVAGDLAQPNKYLPGKHEVSSIPDTKQKKC